MGEHVEAPGGSHRPGRALIPVPRYSVQAAVERIDRTDGDLRIDDLARELDVGPSTLRRHFGVLGMSAKRFASVLRFRRARGHHDGWRRICPRSRRRIP